MIGNVARQSSLLYFVLERQVSLIKDDLLEPVDMLLNDPLLVELVSRALGRRSARSRDLGREGMAPDRLLRCVVLKHLKQWSFRELEREVRNSLVYRMFTHFNEDEIPDFTTFCRNFGLLDEETMRQIHVRAVGLAIENGAAAGKKLRTDTTVVETNVHYPTDSALLADGVRVLTRLVRRAGAHLRGIRIVNHARSVRNRVLEIQRAARCLTDRNRKRFEESYRRLLSVARRVLRRSLETAARIRPEEARRSNGLTRVRVRIERFAPLLDRVIRQTAARVFGGNTHVARKVLSFFEDHTEVIRKGKADKPTEFGRLVRIDEVENGIISNFAVLQGNPADVTGWIPALDGHMRIFARPPAIVVADRGFYSAANASYATRLGVRTVALPARGPLSRTQKEKQKSRAFRRAQRWRAGIEARNSIVKHRYGLKRAFYRGEAGFLRYVAAGVIVNNLVATARTLVRRRIGRRVA